MYSDPGVLAAFVGGALIGSFLNVVIHRLPRDQSLVFPSSRCPSCGAGIRPWHNLPILGFFLLRGRCKDCGQRISLRYPFVEALTALVAAGLWLRYGATGSFVAYSVMSAGLIAVAFIDFDHMIIPDSLSLGGIAVGIASSFVTGLGVTASLLGVVVGAGSLLAVYVAYWAVTRREGLGLGDVKLLAAIGAFLGWQAVLFTIFVSSVVGAAIGGAAVGFKLRRAVPYGSFLAPAALVYIFRGEELIEWYLYFLN